MHRPQSTYRLQFSGEFGFQQANQILEYLYDLGISDIYASPIFKARPGSNHGYDIVDFREINPELGTWFDFQSLQDKRKFLNMGWLQDIVPNHMAYSYDNPFIYDVLEKGQQSKYKSFFDIDWGHPSPNLDRKLIAPFLGHFYGQALNHGDLGIVFDQGVFVVKYFDLKFPLNLRSYPKILSHDLKQLEMSFDKEEPLFEQLEAILNRISTSSTLPLPEIEDLSRQIQAILWSLWQNEESFRSWIETRLKSINNDCLNIQPVSLDYLLKDQYYQLSFWQTAGQEINYRRFFNINDLICLRVEDKDVFEISHSFILDLYNHGYLSGLRIDHLDGLYQPGLYLEQLRQNAPKAFIVVEKILGLDESLNFNWPIQGTTGYDFLNHVNLVFCCQDNEQRFNEITQELTDFNHPSPEEHLNQQKAKVLDQELLSEIDNLARLIRSCLSKAKNGRDISMRIVQEIVRLVFIFFPVYRTYIDSMPPPESELTILKQTFKRVIDYKPDLTWPVECLEKYLTCQKTCLGERLKEQWLVCLLRLQQLTGPIMAKGFEDTFLFSFPRLISLNEVGSNPPRFGHSLKSFHDFMSEKMLNHPDSLSTLSTHDTKYGEDLRARINVLSEIPEEWREMVLKWRRLNKAYKHTLQDQIAPSKTDEYILYQILLGVFPFFLKNRQELLSRLHEYTQKAIREAKTNSDWQKPNVKYEQSVCSFLSNILEPSNNQFLSSFIAFQRKIAFYGCLNSLAQNLIRLTAPGVPDMYQGTEMWSFHLVDPDNRRLVDFQYRQGCLDYLKEKKDTPEFLPELLNSYYNGYIKLYQTWQTLQTRQKEIDLFQKGHYIPLAIKGPYKNHIIAFTRSSRNKSAIIIAPRFSAQLTKPEIFPLGREIWQDTSLIIDKNMPQDWDDVFSHKSVQIQNNQLHVGDALKYFPTALLISK